MPDSYSVRDPSLDIPFDRDRGDSYSGNGSNSHFTAALPHFQSPLIEATYPVHSVNGEQLGYNAEAIDASERTVRSLEWEPSRSARFIGGTGESDPYLLRHYRYDENDECTISKITYRRVNVTNTGEEPPVVFMLAEDALAQKGEPRVSESILDKARAEVASMFTQDVAVRLIGLFFRFIFPSFPILSQSKMLDPETGIITLDSLRSLPLSLLSALYAASLPFMLYDDLLATTIVHTSPPSHQLYRISWLAITHELHTPRLATLQACLILLQRAPTNRFVTGTLADIMISFPRLTTPIDTPLKMGLVGWTVGLAHSLGLMHECGHWEGIPACEKRLRKRLWYGVYVMDKWACLGAGMPSHVKNDDVGVMPLALTDCKRSVSYLEMQEDVSNSASAALPRCLLMLDEYETTKRSVLFDCSTYKQCTDLTDTKSYVVSNQTPNPRSRSRTDQSENIESTHHFQLLAELTTILSDIVDTFFSLRASQRTSKNFYLSLDLGKPLRGRLTTWNASMRPFLATQSASKADSRGGQRLDGNASLCLAYIVATMTLFRALLRPLENLTMNEEEDHDFVSSRQAVRSGAKACAEEVVGFAENLGRGAMDAFWHSCKSCSRNVSPDV